uniref:Bowman-Birk type proteinase inhibitor n=1 Tax=Elaeis guineensis var. tenera TaxID=51953 RepID=A0A6I9SGW0_ELAGV|nr:Bowman-Birk type proteinase inhibitor [Elaeis guineensis]
MKNSLVTVVTLALLAIALSLFSSQAFEEADIRLPIRGYGSVGEEEQKPWPCCDLCLCRPMEPPQCRCEDFWIKSCDPNCKDCAKMPLFVYPPVFKCHDVITGQCGKRCH